MKAIENYLLQNGLQKFRIQQFNKAYYQQLVHSYNEISTLSKDLRLEMSEKFPFSSLSNVKEQVVNGLEGSTIKVLFETIDKKFIEAVLIRENVQGKFRNTICVSTQVGCAMGCLFCATGKMGFSRNLEENEIVDQILYFARILKNNYSDKVTNVVYMGMGEPLLNLDNVLESIEIINSPEKFNLGARNITVSTVGIVSQLEKFLNEKHQYRIAISLHAPNQKIREKIIPSAKLNNLEDILSITKRYSKIQGKRVTYEYILLNEINDSDENALELASLFKNYEKYTFINLIPYNETTAKTENNTAIRLSRSSNNRAYSFRDILKSKGIACEIRYSSGQEIKGACGQLSVMNNK